MSDPEHAAGRAFGVDRGPEDRFYGYPQRVTFVIDPEGIVKLTYVVASAQIAGHVERVLADVRSLLA